MTNTTKQLFWKSVIEKKKSPKLNHKGHNCWSFEFKYIMDYKLHHKVFEWSSLGIKQSEVCYKDILN